MKIGFWGYPDPKVVEEIKNQYPNSEWIDLDIDFGYPKTNILPESYCKIIMNIIDNAFYCKPELIIAPIGKDKCDSGWFASVLLKDMNFNVIQTIYEKIDNKKELRICTSEMPLFDKVQAITGNIIENKSYDIKPCIPQYGFWGVPPNDLSILKLFPNNTHVYGWMRCVEAGTPADIDMEMFVDENIPIVFYSQAFCAKAQLAKYLADKYNGLYIDIDDYASTSITAKIEAFLKLR
ncbi:MAG: hypothetical protein MJ237_04660 [bacterium]|nr:hypothetical protein [bacterium]